MTNICPRLQGSSYSSLDDSIDHDQSRQDSIYLDNSFPPMSSEGENKMGETERGRWWSDHHWLIKYQQYNVYLLNCTFLFIDF